MAQTVPARQTVQNMTEGSPVSLILRFALPIFISQVFQQLYSTADAFIVGKYLGTNAFAAVSSSGTLIMLLTSLFIGTAMGAASRSQSTSARATMKTSRAPSTRTWRSVSCRAHC